MTKEDYIVLELPLPPSANKLFAWYPKRHKSDDYKKWIQQAWIAMLKQQKYTISWDSWLSARYTFFTPLFYKNWNKKKQDLDNFIKPLQDFLWDNIPWFKDEYIREIIAEKKDSEQKICKILIKEIN